LEPDGKRPEAGGHQQQSDHQEAAGSGPCWRLARGMEGGF
jgi:hypothetical protein